MEQLELRMFARFFHQDFGLEFGNANDAVAVYLKSLSVDKKRKLSVEISNFLSEYYGKSHKSKKNAWFRLGAEWWDAEQIVPVLERLANSMDSISTHNKA